MPYINKPKKNYNAKRQQRDIDKKKRAEVYNTALWRRMRVAKQMAHPICEICDMIGRVNLTEDIHHLRSFTEYSGTERDAIAYDYNNLLAVCKEHHQLLHHGYLQGATTLEEIKERIEIHENQSL